MNIGSARRVEICACESPGWNGRNWRHSAYFSSPLMARAMAGSRVRPNKYPQNMVLLPVGHCAVPFRHACLRRPCPGRHKHAGSSRAFRVVNFATGPQVVMEARRGASPCALAGWLGADGLVSASECQARARRRAHPAPLPALESAPAGKCCRLPQSRRMPKPRRHVVATPPRRCRPRRAPRLPPGGSARGRPGVTGCREHSGRWR